jgi:hypothetical protein
MIQPDDRHPDSGNEAAFINLAKSENIFFAPGWYVLKSRTVRITTAPSSSE